MSPNVSLEKMYRFQLKFVGETYAFFRFPFDHFSYFLYKTSCIASNPGSFTSPKPMCRNSIRESGRCKQNYCPFILRVSHRISIQGKAVLSSLYFVISKILTFPTDVTILRIKDKSPRHYLYLAVELKAFFRFHATHFELFTTQWHQMHFFSQML